MLRKVVDLIKPQANISKKCRMNKHIPLALNHAMLVVGRKNPKKNAIEILKKLNDFPVGGGEGH